jgi:ABC-type Fe3+/spermidine/putrescine transport system ATPase subunit
MVFQNYALFPHLSVADNIVFGLQRAQAWTSRAEAARAADDVASTWSACRRCCSASRRSAVRAGSSSAWRWARAPGVAGSRCA